MKHSDVTRKSAKTRLQEWSQKNAMCIPSYNLISKSGQDHSPEFIVSVDIVGYGGVSGSGRSKKEAESDAASRFIKKHLDNN